MTEIIAEFLDALDTPALETLEQFEKMISVESLLWLQEVTA